MSMNNIQHKQKRYVVRLCPHIFVLNLLKLFRTVYSKRAPGKPARLLTPAVVHFSGDYRIFLVTASRNLHKLSYLLLKRHIAKQFIKFLLCHRLSSHTITI